MKKGSVVRRYAKAIIELGQEEDRCSEIGKELKNIASIFASHPELKKLALNPMHKLEERQGLVEKVAAASGASATVKRFLSLLTATRNIGLIEEICTAYLKMADELAGRINVKVESATELDEGRMRQIADKLKQLTNKEVILSVEKNPALIGGLVFRIGNTMLDGSIRTQLEKVRDRIAQ